MFRNAPVCYFSTTIMLVYDQFSFLESIGLTLDSDLVYFLCEKPLEALSHINKINDKKSFLNKCITYTDCYMSNKDVDDIYKKVFDPDKFKNIEGHNDE